MGLCKENGTAYYANHVEKVAGKKEVMNVFEYEYETEDIKPERSASATRLEEKLSEIVEVEND